MDEQEAASAKFILALVAYGTTQRDKLYHAVERHQNKVPAAIQVRLFFLEDLMLKYGLPLADEKEDEDTEPPAAKAGQG